MALTAIINQTRKVDKLIIFDDNDEPEDLRQHHIYSQLFHMMDIKGIDWEWRYAAKKGTHYNHQAANTMGYKWVWRMDDDAIPDANVLKTLMSYAMDGIGGVGGSILTPPICPETSSGSIDKINEEPNPQWSMIDKFKFVDHLHCSFLYRAAIHDYNLGLSRVAHREETLFSWGLKQKGYKLVIVPEAITWHLKYPAGGIRAETNQELYAKDEFIFQNFLAYRDRNIVVLNCGLGDHLVFSKVLPEIKDPLVFSCYPEVIEGKSIAEAQHLFGDLDQWNIYKKMAQWNWTDTLEDAFRKMYL
jgi:hypothetical protein